MPTEESVRAMLRIADLEPREDELRDLLGLAAVIEAAIGRVDALLDAQAGGPEAGAAISGPARRPARHRGRPPRNDAGSSPGG